jgi:hypothetical protein
VAAVLSGCIWGIIITRLIWPISARKELKDGLSLLWLRMSLIWKRYPLSLLAKGESSTGFMSPREKLEIERFLSRLEALQAAARAEFELKSPFPDAAYSNILRRTRSMVDAFHAMNLEMIKSVPASEGELALLSYTAQEREHLSARISHLLSGRFLHIPNALLCSDQLTLDSHGVFYEVGISADRCTSEH